MYLVQRYFEKFWYGRIRNSRSQATDAIAHFEKDIAAQEGQKYIFEAKRVRSQVVVKQPFTAACSHARLVIVEGSTQWHTAYLLAIGRFKLLIISTLANNFIIYLIIYVFIQLCMFVCSYLFKKKKINYVLYYLVIITYVLN